MAPKKAKEKNTSPAKKRNASAGPAGAPGEEAHPTTTNTVNASFYQAIRDDIATFVGNPIFADVMETPPIGIKDGAMQVLTITLGRKGN